MKEIKEIMKFRVDVCLGRRLDVYLLKIASTVVSVVVIFNPLNISVYLIIKWGKLAALEYHSQVTKTSHSCCVIEFLQLPNIKSNRSVFIAKAVCCSIKVFTFLLDIWNLKHFHLSTRFRIKRIEVPTSCVSTWENIS